MSGSNEFVQEIGFDSPQGEGIGEKVGNYKARPREIDRVAFVFPSKVKMVETHFQDINFFCIKGICCEKGGPAKKKFGTVIVQYITDTKGNIIKDRIADMKVLPITFNDKIYAALRRLNTEWPLTQHDFQVELDGDPKFQNLKFTPQKESLFRKNEQLVKRLTAEAEKLYAQIYFGKQLTEAEIKEKFGLEGAAAAVGEVGGSQNYDDLLENIQ